MDRSASTSLEVQVRKTTVRVFLLGTEDVIPQTSFVVDDFALITT